MQLPAYVQNISPPQNPFPSIGEGGVYSVVYLARAVCGGNWICVIPALIDAAVQQGISHREVILLFALRHNYCATIVSPPSVVAAHSHLVTVVTYILPMP